MNKRYSLERLLKVFVVSLVFMMILDIVSVTVISGGIDLMMSLRNSLLILTPIILSLGINGVHGIIVKDERIYINSIIVSTLLSGTIFWIFGLAETLEISRTWEKAISNAGILNILSWYSLKHNQYLSLGLLIGFVVGVLIVYKKTRATADNTMYKQ